MPQLRCLLLCWPCQATGADWEWVTVPSQWSAGPLPLLCIHSSSSLVFVKHHPCGSFCDEHIDQVSLRMMRLRRNGSVRLLRVSVASSIKWRWESSCGFHTQQWLLSRSSFLGSLNTWNKAKERQHAPISTHFVYSGTYCPEEPSLKTGGWGCPRSALWGSMLPKDAATSWEEVLCITCHCDPISASRDSVVSRLASWCMDARFTAFIFLWVWNREWEGMKSEAAVLEGYLEERRKQRWCAIGLLCPAGAQMVMVHGDVLVAVNPTFCTGSCFILTLNVPGTYRPQAASYSSPIYSHPPPSPCLCSWLLFPQISQPHSDSVVPTRGMV